MSTNSTLPPPPYKNPVIVSDSIMTQAWSDWFRALYVRVGKAIAPTNDTISGGSIAGYVGAGGIPETQFTITNNQSTPTNITGLLLGTDVQTAEVEIQFYICTTGSGATEYCSRMKYLATQKIVAGTWDLAPLGGGGDFATATDGSSQPAGILVSITTGGQFQYTSSNVTGTAKASAISFIAKTMFVVPGAR